MSKKRVLARYVNKIGRRRCLARDIRETWHLFCFLRSDMERLYGELEVMLWR